MNEADFRNTRILPASDIRRAGAIVFEISDTRRCAFGEDAIISRSLAIFAALMLTFGGVLTIRDYARTQPQPLVASVDAPDRISSQQPQYLSKDIRDLQVMQDRVLADNPLEDETELPLGEIVPAEWRVVVLEHTDPNGTRHIIERGMPLDEIEADFNVAIASQQDGAIEAERDPSATTELNDPRASLSDASVDLTGASSTVGDGLVVLTGHQTEPIAADPANRACRAGHSNYVRAASERKFIERRDAAPRSTNVAVSLRRDEPCSTPLASIWPVDSHDAFTQNGLHRVLPTKDQRLVSTERDGYFCLSRITTQPLTIGSTIFVDLPEHGISADFTVREIRPCPTPMAGDGHLVTTKFIHENAEILDLQIKGSGEPIGTTASHPFWSEDRQQFVAAGELRVGENLLLSDDTTRRVASITLRPNRETVYNIEVDGEHVFYVGEDGVLVHNTCDWRMWEKQAGKHFKRKGFDVVGSIRNASGHGIDMVLRNRKTGQIFIAEVKARTRSWGALSKLQRQGSAANAGRILKELFDARQSGRGHWAPHNLSPGTTVVESVLREAITDGNFGGGFIVRINEGLRGISETPWP